MALALSSFPGAVKNAPLQERQSVGLPDGRQLCFAEYGAADGFPVFGFHGTPGSRLMFRLAHDPACRAGLRLIAPDRPGFGGSTHEPGRTLAGWASDIAVLAKALGIDRFGVAGISGGGPYAAACAALLTKNVALAALISPMGPVRSTQQPETGGSAQQKMFRLVSVLSPAMRGAFSVGRLMLLNAPDSTYGLIMSRAAPADRPILMRPTVRKNLLEGIAEGLSSGVQGTIEELKIFGRPWDLPFKDIKAPVLLWQGTGDRNVPVAAALQLAKLIPACQLFRIEGAGHYWVFDHMDEVLAEMAKRLIG